MKTYTVVIHYEGAYDYEVEAENEEEAKAMAEGAFMDISPYKAWDSVQWDVCDCWELEGGK